MTHQMERRVQISFSKEVNSVLCELQTYKTQIHSTTNVLPKADDAPLYVEFIFVGILNVCSDFLVHSDAWFYSDTQGFHTNYSVQVLLDF